MSNKNEGTSGVIISIIAALIGVALVVGILYLMFHGGMFVFAHYGWSGLAVLFLIILVATCGTVNIKK